MTTSHEFLSYPPAGESFLAVTTQALMDQRFAVASQMVNSRLGRNCGVAFGIAESGQVPVTSVIWEVTSESRSRLLFNKELLAGEHGRLLVKVLLMTLPLVTRYHAAGCPELGEVALNLDDNGSRPGLSFCANTEETFLIPDVGFMDSRGYQALRDHFADQSVAWDARRPVAFWRGGTSGWSADPGWRNLPRAQLCAIASQPGFGHIFDVGISHISQISDEITIQQIQESGLMRGFVPETEWNRYKYLIDIDGNANAFIGFFVRLLTGSPVLKVVSPNGFRQWFYSRMLPWKHYVPVAPDISDLADKVLWLSQHEEQALKIGIAGQELANSMTYDNEIESAVTTVAASIRRSMVSSRASIVLSQHNASDAIAETMSTMTPEPLAVQLNQLVHGTDVYAGFVPTFAEDLQGWNGQFPYFRDLIAEANASIVIDVGVWKGGSTVFLAELLKERNTAGAVIAVDTFLGSPEHWDQHGDMFHLIPRRHGLPLLYEQFMCNVVRRALQEWVVPFPQASVTAAIILWRCGVRADLIHIDAAHEYEAVLQDVRTYWNLLKPGGFLVGDDYHESWPGVVKAADEFVAQVNIPLQVVPPKWFIRKPM